MSNINAPALTCLAGCPSAGFVLWHSLTGPQNNVAHELKEVAISTIAVNLNTAFFISINGYLFTYSFGFSDNAPFLIVSGLNYIYE
jgi:hypothetical protein